MSLESTFRRQDSCINTACSDSYCPYLCAPPALPRVVEMRPPCLFAYREEAPKAFVSTFLLRFYRTITVNRTRLNLEACNLLCMSRSKPVAVQSRPEPQTFCTLSFHGYPYSLKRPTLHDGATKVGVNVRLRLDTLSQSFVPALALIFCFFQASLDTCESRPPTNRMYTSDSKTHVQRINGASWSGTPCSYVHHSDVYSSSRVPVPRS
ncbi:unnamed protein product [Somion occarium]|uniref:Uncharacterized protein n=1 Tax=Somion occarium TaxID=3059160 RepID=A0ABP1EBW7_9APHY